MFCANTNKPTETIQGPKFQWPSNYVGQITTSDFELQRNRAFIEDPSKQLWL